MALQSVACKCWCGKPQIDYSAYHPHKLTNKSSFCCLHVCACIETRPCSLKAITQRFSFETLTCATPLQYKQDTQQICSTKYLHRGISPNLADPGCSTTKMWPRAAHSQHKSVTRTLITFPNFTHQTVSSPSGLYQ